MYTHTIHENTPTHTSIQYQLFPCPKNWITMQEQRPPWSNIYIYYESDSEKPRNILNIYDICKNNSPIWWVDADDYHTHNLNIVSMFCWFAERKRTKIRNPKYLFDALRLYNWEINEIKIKQ